ncbi:hypothetical protein [Xanthobacter pseudotagetidis]|uniref:hypothetical protein n=1 Tax=Xanthobacter pseudotagetidis TaxID=3119911 RepID=UPI00372BE015
MGEAHRPVHARLAHRAGGRTRLVILGKVPHARLVALADALAAAGIAKVEIRPKTGSIVLVHDTAWEDLADTLKGAGLKVADPAPPEPDPAPIEDAATRLAKADLLMALLTKGRLDLQNAAFLGLTLVGLVQLARGRLAGPALTLFGQAITLAVLKDRRPSL